MARFFIDRPIFAWVISIIVMMSGALAILFLPISAVPGHRPADDQRPGELPRRVREDPRGHGHAGHRAAHERARPPALHGLVERLGRQRAGHAHLRGGHRPRHRAGAGAEQAAARAAAAAAGRAAAGRPRHQDRHHLPRHDRARVARRVDDPQRHLRLRVLHAAGPAEPRHRRRRGGGLRLAVRHADSGSTRTGSSTTGSRRATSRAPSRPRTRRSRPGSSAACPPSRGSASPPPSRRRPGSRRGSSSRRCCCA